MEPKNQVKGVDRRKFLQTGSVLAASALILPLGTQQILGQQK